MSQLATLLNKFSLNIKPPVTKQQLVPVASLIKEKTELTKKYVFPKKSGVDKFFYKNNIRLKWLSDDYLERYQMTFMILKCISEETTEWRRYGIYEVIINSLYDGDLLINEFGQKKIMFYHKNKFNTVNGKTLSLNQIIAQIDTMIRYFIRHSYLKIGAHGNHNSVYSKDFSFATETNNRLLKRFVLGIHTSPPKNPTASINRIAKDLKSFAFYSKSIFQKSKEVIEELFKLNREENYTKFQLKKKLYKESQILIRDIVNTINFRGTLEIHSKRARYTKSRLIKKRVLWVESKQISGTNKAIEILRGRKEFNDLKKEWILLHKDIKELIKTPNHLLNKEEVDACLKRIKLFESYVSFFLGRVSKEMTQNDNHKKRYKYGL